MVKSMNGLFVPAMTYREVAKKMTDMGIPMTAPGVRVIEQRALAKIRKAFNERGITKFSDLYGERREILVKTSSETV